MERELQGRIDEINANIGFLRSIVKSNESATYVDIRNDVDNLLKSIQYHLYLIGIEISIEFTEIHITDDEMQMIEKETDCLVNKTELMKSFIYYSGSSAASYCHVFRAV